jgi:hypothetical protein
LIDLGLYVIRKLWRRRESAASSTYLAFSIGPELLAIGVCELEVQDDGDALAKAAPLFHDGLTRIEVWCGSRKVGNIPPKADEEPDHESIRDSA